MIYTSYINTVVGMGTPVELGKDTKGGWRDGGDVMVCIILDDVNHVCTSCSSMCVGWPPRDMMVALYELRYCTARQFVRVL